MGGGKAGLTDVVGGGAVSVEGGVEWGDGEKGGHWKEGVGWGDGTEGREVSGCQYIRLLVGVEVAECSLSCRGDGGRIAVHCTVQYIGWFIVP